MSYHILTPNEFKKFYPFKDLHSNDLNLILQKTAIDNLNKGNILFKQGDDDSDVFYLLSGSVKLKSANGAEYVLDADSEQARFPIANIKPRNFSAFAHVEGTSIARVPAQSIESLILDLDKDEYWMTGSMPSVSEERILDSEWMMALKGTPLFQKLQDEFLNQLFQVMEEKQFSADQSVINEGEPGDYFYLIKEGTCVVSRKKDGKDVELARLRATDSFGEDALISERPRNATVKMLTDGSLMRISKDDFQHFMFQPMVQWVEPKEAHRLLGKGVGIIDVRKNRDKNKTPKNAKYIPLFMLRNQLKRLEKGNGYLILCDDDHDGAIASYLFSKYGLDGYLLHRTNAPE